MVAVPTTVSLCTVAEGRGIIPHAESIKTERGNKWGRTIRNERKFPSIMTPYQIDTYTFQLQQVIVFYCETPVFFSLLKSETVLFSQTYTICTGRDVVIFFVTFNLPTAKHTALQLKKHWKRTCTTHTNGCRRTARLVYESIGHGCTVDMKIFVNLV